MNDVIRIEPEAGESNEQYHERLRRIQFPRWFLLCKPVGAEWSIHEIEYPTKEGIAERANELRAEHPGAEILSVGETGWQP